MTVTLDALKKHASRFGDECVQESASLLTEEEQEDLRKWMRRRRSLEKRAAKDARLSKLRTRR